MLKKTITYIDYDGHERTEDFYFNLSKAELMDMEMGISGGMTQMINKIVAAQDNASLYRLFTDIIKKAYGEKSPDGRRFIKSIEISESFTQTEAYSALLDEFINNTDTVTSFINGLIPNVDTNKIPSVH